MDIEYRVELSDRSFNLLEVLEHEITDISWDYSRNGGCGGFRFSIPRTYCDEKFISGDFNIKIYIRNSSTKAYDLWYQGLIEDKSIDVRDKEKIVISGHGYSSQLSRIQIDQDYSSKTIEYIVDATLDTVVANTDIIKDTISATGVTADTLEFNTDAKTVIESCADITGTREWGVDKDRKFFFKARSSSVGFNFPLGGIITSFKEDQSFKDMINNVIVQGAVSSGTPFTREKGDTSSQTKYGLREKVIQNSNVSTNTVADQLADAVLAEFKDVIRRASCSLINYSTRVETTIPIPLFKIKRLAKTYGTEKYGTFLYSGEIEYQINRIKYAINKNSVLSVSLNLGFLRPSISEEIKRLENKLEQQRSESL